MCEQSSFLYALSIFEQKRTVKTDFKTKYWHESKNISINEASDGVFPLCVGLPSKESSAAADQAFHI